MNDKNHLQPKSIWTSSMQLPHFKSLQGDSKTDVLIIGGGIAGILCAAFLQERGIDYMLVEARTICSGITQNTTAKITSQHGLIYHKLLQNAGQEKAQMYLHANQLALQKYRDLCSTIDCDFEEKSAFVYSMNDRQKIEQELSALQQLGHPAAFAENIPLPFATAGAIEFEGQAQFHPLKFVRSIANGLRIHENTFVKKIVDATAYTDSGMITAKKIIIATHFPFINRHGSYFLKLYQHRSYVIALENAPNLHGMYVDEAMNGLSFRNYGNLLFIGGGDHRTGKHGGNWEALRSLAHRYYPEAQEQYHWATQDCMSLDGVPYIGHYSQNTPDLLVATGFNKWGMTSSMVSAMLLADMVSRQTNEFAEVFFPHRSILKPQLLANAAHATLNLLTPSGNRCPHMGCALKWNDTEHSWDCPCHGSRFDAEGQLINNPSMKSIKKHR